MEWVLIIGLIGLVIAFGIKSHMVDKQFRKLIIDMSLMERNANGKIRVLTESKNFSIDQTSNLETMLGELNNRVNGTEETGRMLSLAVRDIREMVDAIKEAGYEHDHQVSALNKDLHQMKEQLLLASSAARSFQVSIDRVDREIRRQDEAMSLLSQRMAKTEAFIKAVAEDPLPFPAIDEDGMEKE